MRPAPMEYEHSSYGVDSGLQNERSNLANAYKRSELHPESKLGVYALSAIVVDRAEPAEALKASVCWSMGFPMLRYWFPPGRYLPFCVERMLPRRRTKKVWPEPTS